MAVLLLVRIDFEGVVVQSYWSRRPFEEPSLKKPTVGLYTGFLVGNVE